ncbi:hypothetical protein [Leptolyngbya sp. KIOST-1]|uniref:hypothetical protein n=1 Tax=Leptolyngbya sp. KIOST-1 TaxID=1229172 RepID=UPI0012E04E79|nr:hypothetical protein [Leptolyngbya sp. KIOST-1]
MTAADNNQLHERTLKFFSQFHTWDFISAPAVRGKLDWATYSQYPLSAPLLHQRWSSEDEIVGVRFPNGKGKTSYFLLDIDSGSNCHPNNHWVDFASLLNAMEQLGLFGRVIVRSSFSNGIHVYFPLPEQVHCYKLALAIEGACSKGGFTVKPGTLEIFPNVKCKGSNYNGHRLPLQLGSCVLDDFGEEPIHSDLNALIKLWEAAASQQEMRLVRQAIRAAKPTWAKQNKQVKGNVAEWKLRLEESLEEGWTGPHQTNDIIKEACIYARVFRELNWDEVESWVLQNVPQLRGFQKFCAHRHIYQRRVREWVRANRRSGRYYPYSQRSRSSKPPSEPRGPNNQAKAQDALQRIQAAIARLQSSPGGLPGKVKERQELLCREAGCSPATLRKHLPLWHPRHLVDGNSANDALDLASSASPSCASGGILPIPGQEYVTAQPARALSDFGKDLVTVAGSAETSQNQGVTHPATLRCSSLVQQTPAPIDTSQAIRSTHHQQELLQQMQGLKLVEPPGKIVAQV